MTGDYFAAEDLTQETFVSAYKKMDGLYLAGEKAWLCRIAANKCIDYLKSAKRRDIPTDSEALPDEKPPDEDEPLKVCLNRELMDELKTYCEELPEIYVECAKLYFMEGRSASEIAERTGLKLKAVQSRIYRARELLRKRYVSKERFLN